MFTIAGSHNPVQSSAYVGNPFVDNGLIAIELMTQKSFDDCEPDDLHRAVDELAEIYSTPAWKKELQSIFPNSKYINPSIKNHIDATKKYLNSLIDATYEENEGSGRCVYCGSPAYEQLFEKSHIPLIGSKKFTNYFTSFQSGLHICPRCALAEQFSPIVAYKAGGKPCLIHSNNHLILRRFGKEAWEWIKERRVTGEFQEKENSAVFDEGFKNPQNALFHLAYKFGKDYVIDEIASENDTIVLYHIDNYNQGPAGVRVYILPNTVFKFVSAVMHDPTYRRDWYTLLDQYYMSGKKADDEVPVWKRSPNRIHDYLLRNRSILWAFRDNREKRARLPWKIVEYYASVVRGMNSQRIAEIKELADNISQCIREANKPKRVGEIAAARDLNAFRNQLQLVMHDWQNLGKDEPLTTYDQYVKVLPPGDTRGWMEIRDLIVIRLYEQLHDMLRKESDEEEEE